jgi:hypothetical protein
MVLADARTDTLESEGGVGTYPIHFVGKKCGIVVRVVDQGDEETRLRQANINLLAALVKLLTDDRFTELFAAHKLSLTPPAERPLTALEVEGRKVYGVGAYDDVLRNVVLVLRQVARDHEDVETYLASLGIRPHLR